MAFNGRCEWCLKCLEGQQRYFCSRACSGLGRAAERNSHWTGGRYRRVDGYVVLDIGGRQVLEHRLVAEAMLGRRLAADEIVHHRNEDRADNRPANLAVMTQSQHIDHHRPALVAARRAARTRVKERAA